MEYLSEASNWFRICYHHQPLTTTYDRTTRSSFSQKNGL